MQELFYFCQIHITTSEEIEHNKKNPSGEGFDVLIGFDGGFGAGTGSDDGLSVVGIGTVAGGEDAGEDLPFVICHLTFVIAPGAVVAGDDVAFGITGEEVLEEFRVRVVADGKEEAVDVDMAQLLIGLAFAVDEVGTLHLSLTGEPQRVMLE